MSNDTPKKKRGWIYLLLAAALGICMVLIPKHKADAQTVAKVDVTASLTQVVKDSLAKL
ncbi:hypothetical protein G3A43_09210 [Paraburkholderia aspalathi]|nr:hypothetical protein [Paraburkholderia aspalathi]MBK3780411.1 hypothetical protein [Paraburkholderia aspalathi]